MFDIYQEVIHAEQRIKPYIRITPLDYAIALSKTTQAQVYLKCENYQYTSAFKLRGAFNKLLTLTPAESQRGVVTASTGNHGAALACALQTLQIAGKVFVPEHAASTKVANIRNYEVDLTFYGTDSIQTELHALAYAKQHQQVYISPYNDNYIIAGQGTIGLEIMQQLSEVDVVLVPVGGGGLISGIAGYIKTVSPHTQVIACLPENSPVMAASIQAGHILEMATSATLSDATAGGIEPDAITFELCQRYVDDYILVSETEIAKSLVTILSTQHLLIEGAAGVAVAALLKNAARFAGKNVVVVLSGGNISVETLKIVLDMNLT